MSANLQNGPSSSNSIQNKRPRRRKLKKRTGGDAPSYDDSEDEKLKKRFVKDKKKRKRQNDEEERAPYLKKRTFENVSTDIWKVHNPATFQKLVHRIEESQANKSERPEGKFIDGPWRCALCQKTTCRDNLGDLFGPYYQSLKQNSLWPPFLHKPAVKRRSKGSPVSDVEHYTDLWFHANCLFWAKGLHLSGTQVTGCEQMLPKHWKRGCMYCSEKGGSVECSSEGCSSVYHYPCGVTKGCLFDAVHLSSWCEQHAKMAKRNKVSALK